MIHTINLLTKQSHEMLEKAIYRNSLILADRLPDLILFLEEHKSAFNHLNKSEVSYKEALDTAKKQLELSEYLTHQMREASLILRAINLDTEAKKS